MRMKSYYEEPSAVHSIPNDLFRGRSSKVHNDVLSHRAGPDVCRVLTELQALHRKEGPSIATALIHAVLPALRACARVSSVADASKPARVVHILVGDAVSTNSNAARRQG